MPRLVRTVFAGLSLHITQCGNHRENVFFTPEDREIYLQWLKGYCSRHNVPSGSDTFISKLEKLTGKILQFRPIG